MLKKVKKLANIGDLVRSKVRLSIYRKNALVNGDERYQIRKVEGGGRIQHELSNFQTSNPGISTLKI
jgi:hypothetical protein